MDTDWHFAGEKDMDDGDIDRLVQSLMGFIPKSPKPDPELEKKRNLMRADPVGYEREHSWDHDRSGRRLNHPCIEWVPTHELKKFMEYDRKPGGKDSDGNIHRWEALGDHMMEHGLQNEIILEYNERDGHAHMGEGNHRTQLALDRGIPALPVRVYNPGPRYPRESPTKVPVQVKPEPDWYDFQNELVVPQHLKPSQLGIPTVPRPQEYGENRAAQARQRAQEGLRGALPMDSPAEWSQGLRATQNDWDL